jgi:hypothetical protein
MDQLYLYDRDKGLFKEILKQSKVIQGRYHVAPDYGQELNTANLNQYILDPASGLSDVKQKYPCCVCMPPQPMLTADGNSNEGTETIYQLFFLDTTGRKALDKNTNTSSSHVWDDWNEMEKCAKDFVRLLKKVIRKKVRSATLSIDVDYNRAPIRYRSKFQVDNVSGVSISFVVKMLEGNCELTDYEAEAIDLITIPEFE